jgi:Fur family iron response transcriptional regulator
MIDLEQMLRAAGLRPTKQRLALAALLFRGTHQHVSAEELHQRACAARAGVALATIYNTLHQFSQAGLLRDVTVDADCTYFDTDTSDHHHFFIEDEQRVIDIPTGLIRLDGLPVPPPGTCVTHIDVIVRVRSLSGQQRQTAASADNGVKARR